MKTLEVLSGSAGNRTASHGRFGYYFRARVAPTQPRTAAQTAVRADLSMIATTWKTLTDNQRAGWASLGAQMQKTDSLGKTYTFNGFLAYESVNMNRLTCGDAMVTDAPAYSIPDPVLTLALTLVTTTTPAISVAYTATPLDTGVKAMIYVTKPMSAGKSFSNSYRLLTVTAAAAASPANIKVAYQAKFGQPAVGDRVAVKVILYKNGFVSAPQHVNALAA